MTKQEFIKKIKNQQLNLYTIDCFMLTHFFLNEFGYRKNVCLSIEEEMYYMWLKINGAKIHPRELEKDIKCAVCKTYKKAVNYTRINYARLKTCKECSKKKKELLER